MAWKPSAKELEELRLLNSVRPAWAVEAERDYDMRKKAGTMERATDRENAKFTQFAPGIKES